MPVINISAWEGQSDEEAQKLLTSVTDTVHEVTSIPKDKILVIINEIRTSRWAQAGVQASDPDFLDKSRQY